LIEIKQEKFWRLFDGRVEARRPARGFSDDASLSRYSDRVSL